MDNDGPDNRAVQRMTGGIYEGVLDFGRRHGI